MKLRADTLRILVPLLPEHIAFIAVCERAIRRLRTMTHKATIDPRNSFQLISTATTILLGGDESLRRGWHRAGNLNVPSSDDQLAMTSSSLH